MSKQNFRGGVTLKDKSKLKMTVKMDDTAAHKLATRNGAWVLVSK